MSYRTDGSRSGKDARKSTALSLEQLEARMMAAFGILESNVNLLAPRNSLGSTTAPTSTAPTVSTPIRLSGGVTEVRGRSISASVLGADDGGEANLKYTWRATAVPTGGSIQFAANGTNAAKSNTLTFTGAGNYTVAVTILDQSGKSTVNTLQFTVTQVLTTLAVRSSTNATVTSGSTLASTGGLQLNLKGYDQFGKLITSPQVTWTTTSAPSGGTATNSLAAGITSFTFNRAGRFALTARGDNATFSVTVNVSQTLASLGFTTTDGREVTAIQGAQTSTTNTRLLVRATDQFGNSMSTLPALRWTTTRVPAAGSATVAINSGVATITFTRAGIYGLQARAGNISASLSVTVAQTLTSLATNSGSPASQSTNLVLTTTSRSQALNAVGLDQFGQAMATRPTVTWSLENAPSQDAGTLTATGTSARLEVSRPGSYSVRATSGTLRSNVTLTVQRKLSRIRITPGSTTVETGGTQQFQASGTDQFGQSMGVAVTWSTNGGTISSTGLLTATNTVGSYTVTATSGTMSGSSSFDVIDPTPADNIDDANLATLISTAYADSSITRTEMIQILRSTGNDGSVSSTELADLQFLVAGTNFAMPDYVRNLAKDVVNGNVANATYQGTVAGNLAAGSSATLLNKLVDKWFLGSDEPVILGSGIAYRSATGNLFNGTPSRNDAKQGQLGDCYFIAALVSIADRNPQAVQNMFIDNGDGTYTIRFYAGALGMFNSGGTIVSGFLSGSGTADYVTVNRRLPTYSNGALAYSGYGQSATSSGTTLWIALAEKAYAQWNETTNSSRDDTNTYAGIEGGWMDDVNSQVLGYNSNAYALASASKTTLINNLSANRAVTIGTASGAVGLVGSHAYVITGYDAISDTFSLFNPWGTTHPANQSFAQLQTNCTWYISVDPTSTAPINSGVNTGNLFSNGLRSSGSLAPTIESPVETFAGQFIETAVLENELSEPFAMIGLNQAQEPASLLTQWEFEAEPTAGPEISESEEASGNYSSDDVFDQAIAQLALDDLFEFAMI